jgi:polar amino acid transport system substrate-binding protein
MKRTGLLAVVAACAMALAMGTARAADPAVPAPGKSQRIDQIKQRGTLRVGALGEFPWLKENAGGTGAPFAGPGWELAQDYAERLGVKLVVVPVSHETKVPVLATGQVDMTIAPLAVTPERQKVVDFVVYSSSALCLFGLGSDPKLQGITDIDALSSPDITIAYYTGTPPESWLPQRFPKAKLRGVPGSGANAPVDEILSHRADVAPIDNVAWPDLEKKVPGLVVFPRGDACLQSKEMATPVGLAIAKGQPVFLAWLRAVQQEVEPKLQQTELHIMKGSD